MKDARHLVDIEGPPGNLDERGSPVDARVLMRRVPCAIKLLSGREAEVARMRLPSATAMISLHGPIAGLDAGCVLLEHPIVDKVPKARWHVGFVDDPTRVGKDLHLLCEGEV